MDKDRWDRETDVVVAGYGSAGGISAIVAHDSGVEVILLEKGKYPGGCSLNGPAIKCSHDAEQAYQYLNTLSAGRVPDELTRAFAEGLTENEDFIRELCKVNGARIVVSPRFAMYPFPGGDALYQVSFVEIPGFRGFPWAWGCLLSSLNKFKTIMDNVDARKIEILMETPAQRLIQSLDGAIIGIEAGVQGKEMKIKARRGVVLATGGFEHDRWLQEQYLQGKPFYSIGIFTNTGDGIRMAQKAGAALWHMWLIHGSYGFKFPEYPMAFRHTKGGHHSPGRMPWIVVDKFGRRFMNEFPPAAQDTPHRPMELFDPDLPGYSRIPSFMIFDENGRRFLPIAHPKAIGEPHYEWSKDNSKEIERGWIVPADSMRELAEKIRQMPENEGRMDANTLEETVQLWNRSVDAKKDLLYRPAWSMMHIQSPPFYVVPVWPIISNTQGGPVHNARRQVLDAFGQPIPRLYSAGELGSYFGHLYELGGNLGECFASGRVAGEYAAKEEPL